jgi:hypothetical protein
VSFVDVFFSTVGIFGLRRFFRAKVRFPIGLCGKRARWRRWFADADLVGFRLAFAIPF